MIDRLVIYSRITRFAILSGILALIWAAADCRPACGAVVKSTPDVVIYSGTYPAWPWIDSTSDGKLVCVWREGTQHHYSSNGKVMLSESTDKGITWSAARTIIDAPQIDDRNAAILTISDNDWLVVYNTAVYTDGPGVAMTSRTTDGGQTWSTPQAVGGPEGATWTRGAPIQLSSGSLLIPFYTGGPDQSLAAISNDNGQSWTIHEVPNAPGMYGNEWSVMEMPGGVLAGIIRTDTPGEDGSLYVTTSADMGITWSMPQKTNLQDSLSRSPAQMFMYEGEPWVVYDDARMVSIALATTDDPNLIEWNVDERLQFQYKADGTAISDGGYPSCVSLGGNEVLIVDYYINGATRQIVGYYATLPMPEPGTLAMLAAAAIGALAFTWIKWRKRK
ncbi:MAG: exo-alpha-sialidase [Pirellulales bacterium]|nr:exo-alpha-sialidase [Pirellulales bacterium]